MAVEDSRTGADDGLPGFARSIRQSKMRTERRFAANRLTGEATAQIQGEVRVQAPLIFDEFRYFGIRGTKEPVTCKVNSLRDRLVLAQQFNSMRLIRPVVGAMRDIHPKSNVVMAQP